MIVVLLQLAGAAALILWAVRQIRNGVERAFSAQLRGWLRHSDGARARAAATGGLAALLLQSATAVTMLCAGFAVSGTMAPATGLAIVLGADLGSAAVVQVLLLRMDWLAPLALLIGASLFLRGSGRRKQVGRILVGLGLILTALDLMRAATAPLRDSPMVEMAAGYLGTDLLAAFALGAVLAWAMHSSVAAVLLFVTFAAEGLIGLPAALALVLGANLGGGAIAFGLTLGAEPPARQLTAANLALRGGGAALALLGLALMPADWLPAWPAASAAMGLHLGFNAALVLLGLPLIGPVTRLAGWALPVAADTPAPRVSALNPEALQDPERALACATRELLRMGEEIESMLTPAMSLFADWDPSRAEAIAKREAAVDKMHFETKLYLAKLHQGEQSEAVASRAMQLATVAANLENAGDVISDALVGMAKRMHAQGLAFSQDGWRELDDFHDRVRANAQIALNVLMSADPDAARQLIEQKEEARRVEAELQRRHLARLRSGGPESLETTNIHQEVLRALKQVNTGFCFVGYPIAEQSGELRQTRLKGAVGR